MEITCQVLNVPKGDQMLHDTGIVLRRVHPTSLGYRGVVVEEAIILPIVHEMRGHGDLFHHNVHEISNFPNAN